jgi:hypothetical protein
VKLFHRDVAFLAMKVGTLASSHDLKATRDGLDRWQFPALGLSHAGHASPTHFMLGKDPEDEA